MTSFSPLPLRLVRQRWAGRVPSPAHDSLTGAERQAYIASHPDSYLAVTQSSEDVPGSTLDDVLAASRRALDRLVDRGAFSSERPPRFYVYQLDQALGDRTVHCQTGLVGGLAITDLEQGILRPHERIHIERAAHMAGHLDAVGVQSSPVAAAVRESGALRSVMDDRGPLLVEAHGDDGLTQRVWAIESVEAAVRLTEMLAAHDSYLVDGHHRAAATALHRDHLATRLGARSRGPADWLLTALFPADELVNRAFHRELAGITLDHFIAGIDGRLEWRRLDAAVVPLRGPDELAVWGSGRWIAVRIPLPDDPLGRLDPVRIDEHLLVPAFGNDPNRRDPRVRYRPATQNSTPTSSPTTVDDDSVLCVARPVPIETVLDLADRGQVLPPKSTYFEPKVRSGVFLRAVQ